ncbi:PHB depolymerase family esterase [Sinorhizobium sp. RAC02]|uniref:extracellular catalytic domain type 1 short-chain-length polyhydroxyalkanoate depolymerase n=1 Tax=Sinorhizobium sp. RAC02 TaxID=1842534 RepID=UPI00083E1E92|nr:PHB depolymerase family esterase [Sinorhizobium sp. RAC02]AOF94487.1 esterase, PHB depolymerase family protein [Sinorhizobium sp. RAC02]
MRSLSDTLERLARMRSSKPTTPTASSILRKLDHFGSNPGALSAWHHIPKQLPVAPALVVVLHGCTQTAAGYDAGSGWTALAEDDGFVVLFPEQVRQNNANLCFNWFSVADTQRDRGEALSIRQMIATMVATHPIDERRIYITGLSAGGAMANAMMACYPDVFAGGAIIAGLPYAAASSIPEAFDRMRGHGLAPTNVAQTSLRAASRHDGAWPTISVWHGASDKTVVPENAAAIVAQWRGVHGLADHPTASETFNRHSRSVWRDAHSRDAIELYQISGMGHGTPIDASSGYGRGAPFMLDVGISSTVEIARNWGLVASFERRENTRPETSREQPAARQTPPSGGAENKIQSVIEKALRSAGLMK